MTKKISKASKEKNATRSNTASKRSGKKAARTTTAKLVWRDVTARVRHTPDYLSKGSSHIEITVVSPKGAPLPITSTGYLSHFLDAEALKRAGGPVAFFLAWIEQEAKSKAWSKLDFNTRQGDLFSG